MYLFLALEDLGVHTLDPGYLVCAGPEARLRVPRLGGCRLAGATCSETQASVLRIFTSQAVSLLALLNHCDSSGLASSIHWDWRRS